MTVSEKIKVRQLIVTGDKGFLDKHHLFIKHLEIYFNVKTISTPIIRPAKNKKSFARQILNGFPLMSYMRYPDGYDHHKSSWAFHYKSRILEKSISSEPGEMVLHLFGLSCPSGRRSHKRFAMSLDYTMMLAERNFPAWAKFPTEQERNKWMEAEREAYQKASFLFPFSKVVAKSLQNDYGIDASKIVTTGAGANFIIGDQKKDFGSLNIIMNGTDFYRKGCDIAVEAMNKVAEKIPGARLFIIGADNGPATANVIYKGRINDKDELSKLFLEADIALGPARCDPYPGFILEAMNFGVPCIVSDRDGMPEMIDHNIDGIVLEDIDSSTLAQYITGLLLNRERLKEFSVACKRKVAMELNWDVAAKKIFNTINNN